MICRRGAAASPSQPLSASAALSAHRPPLPRIASAALSVHRPPLSRIASAALSVHRPPLPLMASAALLGHRPPLARSALSVRGWGGGLPLVPDDLPRSPGAGNRGRCWGRGARPRSTERRAARGARGEALAPLLPGDVCAGRRGAQGAAGGVARGGGRPGARWVRTEGCGLRRHLSLASESLRAGQRWAEARGGWVTVDASARGGRARGGRGEHLVDHLLALKGALALEGLGHDEDGDVAAVGIAVCRNHLQLDRLQRCRRQERT
jgi:hypothetical protein